MNRSIPPSVETNGAAAGNAEPHPRGETGRWRRPAVLLLAAALAAAGVAGCDDSDDDGLDAAKDEAVAHVHSAAVTLGNDLENIPDPRRQVFHIGSGVYLE